MSKKVKNLNEQRRKKNPRTLDEAAQAALRRYEDMATSDEKEPKGIASGNMDNLHDEDDKDE